MNVTILIICAENSCINVKSTVQQTLIELVNFLAERRIIIIQWCFVYFLLNRNHIGNCIYWCEQKLTIDRPFKANMLSQEHINNDTFLSEEESQYMFIHW